MSATWPVPSPRDVGVILVAAGQGLRMGGDRPKQFLTIAGVPMLLRAIRPFAQHPEVAHIVAVLPPGDAAQVPDWLAPHVGDRLSVVAGGAQRTDSVAAGLAALPAACSCILVHDAARPFITASLIHRVVVEARAGHAVIPVLPVTDTIKQVSSSEATRVEQTVAREGLRRAQTPQGFPRATLEAAFDHARRQGLAGTDDASLVEQMGKPVHTVPGDAWNVKVTTVEDLELAEFLARRAP